MKKWCFPIAALVIMLSLAACGNRRVQADTSASRAADAPLVQLSLTTEVEDYSTNEKIFYPPQVLDATDTPPAEGGAGSPAYYAPWGDVVMFCKDLLSER